MAMIQDINYFLKYCSETSKDFWGPLLLPIDTRNKICVVLPAQNLLYKGGMYCFKVLGLAGTSCQDTFAGAKAFCV